MPETDKFQIQTPETGNISYLKSGKIKGKKFEEFYGDQKAKEIKSKMSNSSSGKKKSEKHRESISRSKKGIPLSEKQRETISNGLKGREVTKETREKLKKSNLNKTQKHSIKLECLNIETREIIAFNNVEQAKRQLNCTRYQLLQNKLKGFDVKRI